VTRTCTTQPLSSIFMLARLYVGFCSSGLIHLATMRSSDVWQTNLRQASSTATLGRCESLQRLTSGHYGQALASRSNIELSHD
jgi:hypothetical protein